MGDSHKRARRKIRGGRKKRDTSRQARVTGTEPAEEEEEKEGGGRDWHGRRSERGQREGDFESARQTRETELVR